MLDQINVLVKVDITIIDIVQMLIITLALYYLTKSLYNTRAWILMKGMLIIGAVYMIICLANMSVLQVIMQGLFSTLMIAIVIMLQPELQKIVEMLGQRKFKDFKSLFKKQKEIPRWYSEKSSYEIVAACEHMGSKKTGALIVLERGIPLTEHVDSGIYLGSALSSQLLINIFEKDTPLHDGAVIIRNNKIESATCYLPLSTNYGIDKSLGTRHRAALGISETSDAIVVVVSEETGSMSFCVDGKIYHNVDRAYLSQLLQENMKKSDELITTHTKSKTPFWIKIISPILAACIWMFAIIASDPITTKTIDDVKVETINTYVLDNTSQTYAIQSGDTIDVKIRGRRSEVDSVTNTDIIATADFSEMSTVNAIHINVKMAEQFENIEVVSNSHVMKVQIEELVQTTIPVEVVLSDDVNQKKVIVVKNVEAQDVLVACPEEIAKTLDKAILNIDAYGKEADFVTSVAPIIYDKNGNVVSDKKYSLTKDSVRVSLSVLDVVEVPIILDIVNQDKNANVFYELVDYELEYDTVSIGVPKDKIADVKEVVVNVDLSGNTLESNTVLFNVEQYIPNGCYMAKNQPEQIKLTMNLIKYEKIAFSLSQANIKLINSTDSALQNASVTNFPKNIVLTCNTSIVDPSTITLEMLNPHIEIGSGELVDGIYTTKLLLTDIEGVETASDLTVKYKLERKG